MHVLGGPVNPATAVTVPGNEVGEAGEAPSKPTITSAGIPSPVKPEHPWFCALPTPPNIPKGWGFGCVAPLRDAGLGCQNPASGCMPG